VSWSNGADEEFCGYATKYYHEIRNNDERRRRPREHRAKFGNTLDAHEEGLAGAGDKARWEIRLHTGEVDVRQAGQKAESKKSGLS